jgi:transcriptional regulator of arginine metabolism
VKKKRHEAIIRLIEQHCLSTQTDLLEMLKTEGFDTTQATISRDINELNLVKSEGVNKKSKYIRAIDTSKAVSSQSLNIFKHSTVSISYANNLIVVKTLSGHANAVGMVIDDMCFPQVLGSVAGDDVVLVVAKSENDADIVVKSLRNI